MFADDADRFEQGPGGVGELDPVDGEVDVGDETGGVIPNFEEVGGDLEAEGVDEDFEVGILAFRGGFAALIDDGSDDEVVETTAGDEFVDEFQLDAMVAVIFCRINDKGSWTKRHSVGKWVRQNGRAIKFGSTSKNLNV